MITATLALTLLQNSSQNNKPNLNITDPTFIYLMYEKQFDYSSQLENEIIQKIEESKEYDEKLDAIIRLEYLEDKLRSQKVAKQFKQWLGLKDNEFNPVRNI